MRRVSGQLLDSDHFLTKRHIKMYNIEIIFPLVYYNNNNIKEVSKMEK